MLNSKGERELAYVVEVGKIEPMVGYDSLELATVNSWTCVIGKGQIKEGDLAVYFEIDSKLPEVEPFCSNAALVKYKYKIKTQRFGRGGIPYLSQGLLMSLEEFRDTLKGAKLGDFLTKKLNITYYEKEDNTRKANLDKYTSMRDRHKKFFKTKFGRWLMRHELTRKICFLFLGKKKDKKTDWSKVMGEISKTDEERVENCFNAMRSLNKIWVPTEKIDGTSSTYFLRRGKKMPFITASRNVVYDTPEKEVRNFYKDSDGNVYLEMAAKYRINEALSTVLEENKDFKYISFQGETFGGTIQKRNYGPEHRLRIFNVIYEKAGEPQVRLNPLEMEEFIKELNAKHGFELETVPILAESYELPETIEEIRAFASGASEIDGGMREGAVFRTLDGKYSFKSVDPEFLMKYHG